MARSSTRDQAIKRIKKDIVPVAEAAVYVKLMLYGRNGKGKTRIGASGPKTIILDINEEGTTSVRNYPNCFVYHAKKWSDVVFFYWYLKEGDHPYETVLIDTLTQAQKLCMKAVLKQAEDRDPNRPPATPDRRAWGQMSEMIRPVIFDFRNLPMHVVFVCQERVDKADEDEESEIKARFVPDLSPSVRGDAMAAVDIMGRVYRRPVRVGKGKKEQIKWETRMLVGDHEDYETKDRTGQLSRVLRDPTMQTFIDAKMANPIEEDEE